MSKKPVEIAATVRRLRNARGWTLDMAAARTGVSKRSLQQLEAASANPSLSTLLAIAEGFDVTLVDLLASAETPRVQRPTSNADAPVLWSTESGSEARMLSGLGPLELWAWLLAPGDQRVSKAHRAGSLEVLTVATGRLELHVADRRLTLAAAQSIAFEADAPHSYRNPTTRKVRFTSAVYEPTGAAP